MLKISALKKLIHELSQLPGIGPKTAGRLAYFILKNKDYSKNLREALVQVENEVHDCPVCFSFTDNEAECDYCLDPMRSDDIICVVEDPANIERIDSSGVFKGRYHVLRGALSPLDGIGVEDLKIKELVHRIEKKDDMGEPLTKEIILALDADLEGDTTVLYLSKSLREMGFKVSRIAQGVPIGGDIDYIDERTMGRAMEYRVEL